MRINKNIIETIINLQKENNINNNELLLFFYAITDGQITPLKSLLLFNILSTDLIEKYVLLLSQNEIISKKEILFLDKLSKNKSKIMQIDNKENDIDIIIDNLNCLNNTHIKPTKIRSSYILKLLKQKYSIEDLIMVNEYFHYKWNSNPEMVKYIRIETLYNNKFESRYEEAKIAFSSFFQYKLNIEYIFNSYNKVYYNEICNDSLTKNVSPSFVEQENITFWLKRGYTEEDIVKTIIASIKSWKSKIELIPLISLTRILDDKFEDRKKMAELKMININENNSNSFLENWKTKKDLN